MGKTSKRNARKQKAHHPLISKDQSISHKIKVIQDLLKGPRNYDDGMGGFPDHDTPFMLPNNP